ncbi:MFS transporter [Spongiactinospora gelatinilytica]|uniref:MFS transporter n=1 Tax=Spongiactinospora gelatinilytica TaxID=2666298 RepID=A0A2W2GU65_9ACTN|nr:MFS transporter [Spongiactinospora gelatinilytica]PZG51951.1 MFS transporter [Spongiactinospora gelatinilytica]
MTTTTAKAGWKEWVGLAVLVLPVLLVSMDLSVLFFALPMLSQDLTPTGSQLLWIVDIYGFFLAGLLITMGSLGDRIGRKRLLMLGALAFGGASVVAAYSTSAEMLIAARALLGLGGATLAPSTLSLLRNMFHDDAQRRTAIGVWTGAFSGGLAIGPIIAGALLEFFWWGSVFLINVPVMVLLLVLGAFLLPEFKDPNPGRFDLLSAVLSMAGVLAVIYGVKQIAEDGVTDTSLIAIGAGLVIGLIFVIRQVRMTHPLIDPSLFRRGAFTGSILANTMVTFAAAGLGILAVQYLQVVLGISPFRAALWMLPTIVGTIVGVTLASVLAKRIRPGLVIGLGLVIGAAGFALVSQIQVGSSVVALLTGYIIVTLGLGLVIALATDLIVAAAPPERAGAAAALSETASEFGGALGIATLGSVAIAVYRDQMSAKIPEQLTGEAADAAGATLGGAVAVAEQAPPGVKRTLLESAFESFTQGFHFAAYLSTGLLVLMAILVVILLRKMRMPDTASADAQSAASPTTTSS